MQINAIVTDLDDTLLNAESRLSPYTLEVLRRAGEKGVRVIPASGRAAYSMLPFARQLNTGLPYIACNGAQLVNADHTVMETVTLPVAKAREIIRYLKQYGFYVQCYRDEDFFYEEECDASASYRRSSGMHGHAVGDLAAFVDFPTPKVLSVQDPAVITRLLPQIQAAFPDVPFTLSKPYFLEAEPNNVSKGSALRRLAQMLNLSPEHTLVFGDSLNDLPMLDYAVHSVAMGNARDEVKQAARHVCGSNVEDGVARFVEQQVLQ